MKISKIDDAIEVCEKHLKETNSFNTEIESFLVRYLLLLICSSFEQEIEKIIISRCSRANDPDIISFAKSCVGAVFRSINTSEIAGLLNRFGMSYKEKFREKIKGTKAETYYNNIVVNRHKTAHESGSNLTFKELIEHYEEGHTILDAVIETLELC